MINIDALNDEEKLAALESIHKSIAESKEIQKKKITTNVEMIVKALKKIESDLKQRYDETGSLIANLKNGTDGRDGRDGKDGKDGRNGKDGAMGPRGYDGLSGRNGLDGADGVSVTDAHIDFDGSLIIHLSSGRVINVGEVVAPDIAEKIKVITNGGGTSQFVLDTLASLQAQISAISSGLDYQGTWNASTNTPTLASSVGVAGYYYIVGVAGSTNLDGITDWQVGDWAIFNGTVWQKLDNTDLVTSVAGRTGAIVLTTADIGGLGTIATQAASAVAITGGSINGTTVGATTASTGAFTTLSASSTATLSALTASTALALDASKNIVSVTNTGTGSNVLATSPTLVTPALGTPSALVGTNITGTASGLTAGNVTTNANLTGAVTSVGNATSLGSFTSAQLSGALTDETGSGSAVFATSPTLVTPALGTPSSGVVTNLTGTASININGTVGATTASTGAFTTLSASGVTTLQAGTVSLPALTTTGDTNTGIFFPAADTIAFTEGGVESMRIDSSGNVGIGTTSSLGNASRLSVQVDGSFGSVAFSRNTDNTFAVATDYYKSRGSASSPTAVQNGDDLYQLRSVPYQGSAYTYLNSMKIQIDGTYTSGQNPPTRILWSTNTANGSATERMRLDASGNLGLGVTPSAWSGNYKALQSGNGSAFVGFVGNNQTFVVSNAYNDGSWKYKETSGAGYYAIQGVSNGVHAWYTAGSGTAGNAITFTQAMTLNASGNLLVGTTSEGGVGITAYASGYVRANTNGTTLGQYQYASSMMGTITTDGANIQYNANNALVFGSGGTTERARIDSNGNFMVGTTAGGTYSMKLAVLTNIGLIPTTQNTVGSIVSLKSQLGSSGGEDFIQNQILTYTNAANYTTGLTFNLRNGASTAEGMRLTNTGLGIGTTSPSATAKVTVRDASYGLYRAENTVGGYAQFGITSNAASNGYLDSSNAFLFNTDATERMRLTSTGLGIGNTAPTTRLEITGSGTALSSMVVSGSSATNNLLKYGFYATKHYTTATAPLGLVCGETQSAANIVRVGGGYGEVTAATSIEFYTAANNTTVTGSERGRVTSGGQFLFGTSTENLSRWGRANFYYPSGTSNATISLQNGTTRASGNKYGILFADNTDESNAAVYVNQNNSGNNSADLLFGTNSGTGGAGLGNVTERMRITSTGNVGIGTSSPAYKLHTAITVAATSTVQDVAYFSADSSGSTTSGFGARLLLATENANGNVWPAGIAALNSPAGSNLSELGFYTATAGPTLNERARIDSSGNLLVGVTSANANGGVLQLKSGITFPATAVAATDANTLDDYEEGTWTPSVGGTATYTAQTGTYTRIGRQVTLIFDMTILLLGTGSNFTITGLPFSAASMTAGSISYFGALATSVTFLSIQLDTSNLRFISTTTSTTTVTNHPTIFGNSARVAGTVTYFV